MPSPDPIAVPADGAGCSRPGCRFRQPEHKGEASIPGQPGSRHPGASTVGQFSLPDIYGWRIGAVPRLGTRLPLLRQVMHYLESEQNQDTEHGEQEHHRILTNGDGCRLIFMDWRRGVVYRMLRCRFLCLGRRGRSGGISHAWHLGNRQPIRIWPGNRMDKRRWITHGLADGPTSGDGENDIPGQEKSPVSRPQTIQGNHDMTLANKPSRGVPRLLNSDGEQSCGLRASRKQDIHGNCWKSGFSRG